jgi:hypothetical protein
VPRIVSLWWLMLLAIMISAYVSSVKVEIQNFVWKLLLRHFHFCPLYYHDSEDNDNGQQRGSAA